MHVCSPKVTSTDLFECGSDIFRHIVESATDYAIVTTTPDGIVTTWSAGATFLLGYSPDEMIGQSLGLIFTFDDQLQGAFLSEMRTAHSDGRADDNRWHVRKDATRLWASGLLMPLRDDAGHRIGFVKILRDRTKFLQEDQALRSSEERLRLILQSAVDYAIFTFDNSGYLLDWNVGARRMLGYDDEEILGQDARVLFTPEEQEAGALEWEIETANREGRAENERFHVRKDGTRFWGSGLTVPLKSHHGGVGYLKIMRDETERHRAEEHQQVMMREMSHRVKNSLMLVKGMLSMQARGAAHDVRHALTDAESRIATIAAVHDHLWRQPSLETIDLADFLKGLCDRLGQTSNDDTIEFDGSRCEIDSERAIQVALLVNELVTNAFKHAYPVRGGKVDVSVHIIDQSICVTVSDQGIGLGLGVELRESSRESLGMKIVNGLVTQLKGEIVAEDANPGARFITRMPIVV